MTRGNQRLAALIGLFLLLVMLSGCVHRQFVTQPYPRWGEESAIDQAEDAPPLLLRTMRPAVTGDVPACMLLVHGMNEYIGRYEDIARHFSRHFLVAGFDLHAHGLSNPLLWQADQALHAGEREWDVSDAYLAQAQLRNLEPMRLNLEQALQRLITVCDAQGEPDTPVLIVAHSLGALVAASYLLSEQPPPEWITRIQGIVLLGPAFSVPEVPGWRGWLANPLIKLSFHAKEHFLYPQDQPLPLLAINQLISLVTVPLLDGLFEVLSWPGLRYWFTPVTPGWVLDYLTDSEEEKARIHADGWMIHRNLLRYVKGIESEIVRFRRQMGAFAIPYFLVYSGRDPITPAWGSQYFVDATFGHHPDNAVLPLPELSHHEHLFSSEPLRGELLQKIDQWLMRRLQALDEREAAKPYNGM